MGATPRQNVVARVSGSPDRGDTIGTQVMSRYRSPYVSSYALGPGPLSTMMKALIGANVVMFLLQNVSTLIPLWLTLVPSFVVFNFELWRLATYMFLHGSIGHILFNMLALWM